MIQKLAVLTVALLAGCATHESFSVSVIRPAPVDLGQYDLVAVDRIEGAGCMDFTAEFASALERVENPLTGIVDFEIVDRNDVDRTIDDMRRYPKSNLGQDPNSAFSKWKRAPVQISGVIHRHACEETMDSVESVDAKGARHTTFVRRASARFCVTIEARDTVDNRVLDRVRIDEAATATVKKIGAEPATIAHDQLLARARRQAIRGYLRRIVPHEERVLVHLYTDGDLPQIQIGNGFARTSDWEAALDSYDEAAEFAVGELAEIRHKAIYNRGIALLQLNRFEDAREALKTAYALNQDPETLKHLTTISQRQKEHRVLESQSRRATPAPTTGK